MEFGVQRFHSPLSDLSMGTQKKVSAGKEQFPHGVCALGESRCVQKLTEFLVGSLGR